MSGTMRNYTIDDLESVLTVWDRASAVGHPFLSEEFLESERIEIAETYLPLAETILYEVDGQVVGFLSLVGNEVGGLFVDPAHQRQGIGGELMGRARALRPFLQLAVFRANTVGRRFYESCGFRKVGEREHGPTGRRELILRLD